MGIPEGEDAIAVINREVDDVYEWKEMLLSKAKGLHEELLGVATGEDHQVRSVKQFRKELKTLCMMGTGELRSLQGDRFRSNLDILNAVLQTASKATAGSPILTALGSDGFEDSSIQLSSTLGTQELSNPSFPQLSVSNNTLKADVPADRRCSVMDTSGQFDIQTRKHNSHNNTADHVQQVLKLERENKILRGQIKRQAKEVECSIGKTTKTLEKMRQVRTDVKPLEEMFEKQQLVDVGALQADIVFYEKERQYLYSKVFGCDMEKTDRDDHQGGAAYRHDKAKSSQPKDNKNDAEKRTFLKTIKLLRSEAVWHKKQIGDLKHKMKCNEAMIMQHNDFDGVPSKRPKKGFRKNRSPSARQASHSAAGSDSSDSIPPTPGRLNIKQLSALSGKPSQQNLLTGDGDWKRADPSETVLEDITKLLKQSKADVAQPIQQMIAKTLSTVAAIDQSREAGMEEMRRCRKDEYSEVCRKFHNKTIEDKSKLFSLVRSQCTKIRDTLAEMRPATPPPLPCPPQMCDEETQTDKPEPITPPAKLPDFKSAPPVKFREGKCTQCGKLETQPDAAGVVSDIPADVLEEEIQNRVKEIIAEQESRLDKELKKITMKARVRVAKAGAQSNSSQAKMEEMQTKAEGLEAFIRAKNKMMENQAISLHHTIFRVLRKLGEDLQVPEYAIPQQKKKPKAEKMDTEVKKFEYITQLLAEDEVAIAKYYDFIHKANVNALAKIRAHVKEAATLPDKKGKDSKGAPETATDANRDAQPTPEEKTLEASKTLTHTASSPASPQPRNTFKKLVAKNKAKINATADFSSPVWSDPNVSSDCVPVTGRKAMSINRSSRSRAERRHRFRAFCNALEGPVFEEFSAFFVGYASDAVGLGRLRNLLEQQERKNAKQEVAANSALAFAIEKFEAVKCPDCNRAQTSSPYCSATGNSHIKTRKKNAPNSPTDKELHVLTDTICTPPSACITVPHVTSCSSNTDFISDSPTEDVFMLPARVAQGDCSPTPAPLILQESPPGNPDLPSPASEVDFTETVLFPTSSPPLADIPDVTTQSAKPSVPDFKATAPLPASSPPITDVPDRLVIATQPAKPSVPGAVTPPVSSQAISPPTQPVVFRMALPDTPVEQPVARSPADTPVDPSILQPLVLDSEAEPEPQRQPSAAVRPVPPTSTNQVMKEMPSPVVPSDTKPAFFLMNETDTRAPDRGATDSPLASENVEAVKPQPASAILFSTVNTNLFLAGNTKAPAASLASAPLSSPATAKRPDSTPPRQPAAENYTHDNPTILLDSRTIDAKQTPPTPPEKAVKQRHQPQAHQPQAQERHALTVQVQGIQHDKMIDIKAQVATPVVKSKGTSEFDPFGSLLDPGTMRLQEGDSKKLPIQGGEGKLVKGQGRQRKQGQTPQSVNNGFSIVGQGGNYQTDRNSNSNSNNNSNNISISISNQKGAPTVKGAEPVQAMRQGKTAPGRPLSIGANAQGAKTKKPGKSQGPRQRYNLEPTVTETTVLTARSQTVDSPTLTGPLQVKKPTQMFQSENPKEKGIVTPKHVTMGGGLLSLSHTPRMGGSAASPRQAGGAMGSRTVSKPGLLKNQQQHFQMAKIEKPEPPVFMKQESVIIKQGLSSAHSVRQVGKMKNQSPCQLPVLDFKTLSFEGPPNLQKQAVQKLDTASPRSPGRLVSAFSSPRLSPRPNIQLPREQAVNPGPQKIKISKRLYRPAPQPRQLVRQLKESESPSTGTQVIITNPNSTREPRKLPLQLALEKLGIASL